MHGKRPPPKPKVNQVLRLIAMLDGFIGCKGDGEPPSWAFRIFLHECRKNPA